MKVVITLFVLFVGLAVAQLNLLEPTDPGYQYSKGLDNIANLYGNFNSPLSYSSGNLGILNLSITGNFFLPPPLQGTNLGYIVPSLVALLEQVATSSIVYTESGTEFGQPYFISVSGLQNVAIGLFLEGLLAPKLYSQRSSLSTPIIQVGLNQVNVTHVVTASGLSASNLCQQNPACYPVSTSDVNLNGFWIVGEVTFVLVVQNFQYKISQINNVAGITFKPVPFDPNSVNFAQW